MERKYGIIESTKSMEMFLGKGINSKIFVQNYKEKVTKKLFWESQFDKQIAVSTINIIILLS